MQSPASKKSLHPNYRKAKGCVVGYDGKCYFIYPGDNFTDLSGRKYRVAEDGSLRGVKE